MRSLIHAREGPAVEDADTAGLAPERRDLAGVARRPEQLVPRAVLNLQRQAGNAAVARLVRERDGAPDPAADKDFKKKIKAISGGVDGLTLDITWRVSGQKATTLQCVQAWWGSGSTLGQKVGKTPIKIGEKEYEAFIDGGQYSPWVTLSGEAPAHPTQPYYLDADEHKDQVTWKGEKGKISIYDLPSASAVFEEMFFETAIVAVDVDGKGTDEILKVFTWGSTKQGTVTQHEEGDKIDNKYSHIKSTDSPSSTFTTILKNDYPEYKFK